ncbi:hypothetical protein, partial [Burkholderia ubonensis]|uniref:hypothetical protein n=1 Tax=Burkholderia ubonensis TaxID=101571 RepID=UPI001E2CAF87
GNVLPPISGEESLTNAYLAMSNVVIGNPLLSFENASLDNAMARLTMPFEGGAFSVVVGSEASGFSVDAYSSIAPGDPASIPRTARSLITLRLAQFPSRSY